jgi:hypothetical protein
MREIRLYSSEGGEVLNPLSLPLCAPTSAHKQQGESPSRAGMYPHVTERNCVAARRGGEQREVNNRSVG